MSVLQKDYKYVTEVIPGAPYSGTPSSPGYVAPPDNSTGDGVRPYTRMATFNEVRALWPYLRNTPEGNCQVSINIYTSIITTQTHGHIFRELTFFGPEIRDGGPLRWEWIEKGYLAVQWVTYGGNRGLAYAVVIGERSDVEVFANPVYDPNFVYNGEVGC